jgi:hypothetical protein
VTKLFAAKTFEKLREEDTNEHRDLENRTRRRNRIYSEHEAMMRYVNTETDRIIWADDHMEF